MKTFSTILGMGMLLLSWNLSLSAQTEKENEQNPKQLRIEVLTDEDGQTIEKRILITESEEPGEAHEIRIDADVLENNGARKIVLRKRLPDGEEQLFQWSGDGPVPEALLDEFEGENYRVIRLKAEGVQPKTGNAFMGVKLVIKKEITEQDGVRTESETGRGLFIEEVFENSPAENAGLRAGDHLLVIDGKKTESFDELFEALGKKEPGQKIEVDFGRGELTKKTTLILGERPEGAETKIISKHLEIDETQEGEKVIIRVRKSPDIQWEENPGKNISDPSPNVRLNKDSQLELTSIDLFPNPTDGNIRLRFTAEPLPTSIRIHNMEGKIIYQNELPSFKGEFDDEIRLDQMASGTLILRIAQADKTHTERIILQ